MTDLFHYTACGLDYIYLQNGYERHESKHGSSVSIENADELHDAIAHLIVSGEVPVRGQEVRFLRGLMHLPQTAFGRMLGVERGTVARWEGRPNELIPAGAAKLLCSLYALKVEGRHEAARILEIMAELSELTDDLTARKQVELHNTPGGWRPAKAA